MKNKSLTTLLLSLTLLSSAYADQEISLGVAADYNAIVFGDFTATSSDVEGRLAVQGNVNINNYSVGDKLDSSQLHDVLVSGGNITFPSGRVYYGNILAAGNVSGIGSPVSNGMEPGSRIEGNTSLPIDFSTAYNQLTGLSQTLTQLPVNTTFDSQWGGLYLHGDCNSDTQVFNLDGDEVLAAHTFQVDCIPAEAYVVFNVSGQNTGLTNMSLVSLESHRERVIFNFYEASNLTLAGIGVEGTVLAPYADINNPQGVIKGQLVAKSWNGMMQINNNLFAGQTLAVGNQNPVASNQFIELSVDEVVDFTLNASDADGDLLTYTLNTEVTFGTINGTAPNLTYTPLPGFVGVDQLTYQVNDGELDSDTAEVTFSVGQTICELYPYSIDNEQLINAQLGDQFNNYSTSVGAGNYSLLTWDGSNDTNTLAASFTMPGDSQNYINPDDANDSSINIGDWVQGAPGKNNAKHVRDALDDLLGQQIIVPLWSDTRGSGSNFDYEVVDFARIELTSYKLNGQSNISFIYHGKADCANYAPFTLDGALSTEKNVSIDFVLSDTNEVINGVQNLLTVIDADQDELTYTITSQPAQGTLSGTGPQFNYTPVQNFAGTDSFDFKVNDGSTDSNTSTITIEVIQNNQVPVALEQNLQVNENQSIAITLTGQDEDNDPLDYAVVDQPANGQLSGMLPDLSYTPNNGFNGFDVFTFTVNDGQETSTPAMINIEVLAVNDAPSADDISINTSEDTPVDVTLMGFDPEGDVLIYQLLTQPSSGVLTGTIPDFSYTPNTDFNGTDSFTYSVNDGQLDSNVATVSITVSAGNDAPFANDVNITTDEDNAAVITLIASDPENDSLNFNLLTQPTNGSLTGTAPNLTYTPNTDFNGADSFTYMVNDGSLDSNVATVSITVNAGNDAPTANELNIVLDEDTSAVITLSGSDPEGDNLTFNLLSQPTNGMLSGSAPEFVYTPNVDFNGTDSFTYSVNDGSLDSNVATVSIDINAGNDAPVAIYLDITTDEDTAVNVTLTGTDPEGDALTFQLLSQTINGVLSGTAPNLIYTPNTNFNGTDSFTYSVNDGSLDSNVATISIAINSGNDAPSAASLNLSTDEDDSVNITLIGSDPEGDALTYQLLSAPVNGVLSGIAPDLSYTPNTDFNGTDSFTYSVNDGQLDSNVATVNITINSGNDAPVANDVNVTTDEDTSVIVTISGSDPENDGLTFNILTQPTNGVLSGTAPALTYTPNADFYGNDTFTFLVNDGQLNSNVATVSLTVNSINDAPVANPLSISVDEDGLVQISLSGFDIDGDVLSYVLDTQPVNGILSGSGNTYTYTPNPDYSGSDGFSYHVNDGTTDSLSVPVSITVIAGNDEPVANNLSVDTNEDSAVNLTLSGSDPEGDSLTYQLVSQPINGVLSGTTPDLTYTPNIDFNGTDSFTYSVNDGLLDSNVATVLLTVAAVNDAPIANAQNYVVDEDSTSAILLSGSDVDGDVLSFVLDTQPINGTLAGTADSYTYTPNTNFNGTDSFTYHVNDGTVDSAVVEVIITVSSSNDAPVANDLIITTVEDTAAVITLSGSDPEGDALTYQVITQPTNGVLSGTAPDLTYTPNADFNGADSFTYSVNDDALDSNVATVNININSANDAPTANDATVTTDEDTAAVITLSGSDPEGDALTYQVITQPTNGVLSGTAPDLTYTPNADFNGADSFTYNVIDGVLDSNVATVNITINSANDAPTANVATVTTDEDTAAVITLSGSDPEGDTLTYQVITQPTNGVLSGAAPDLTYTPNTDFNGSVTFTFVVNDGQYDSAAATVLINIIAQNDVPLMADQTLSVDEDTPLDINLLATDVDGDNLVYTLVNTPVNGDLSGDLPQVTYLGAENFFGSDLMTVQVDDGQGGVVTAVITIQVIAINDQPIADAISVNTPFQTPVSLPLSGTDVEDSGLTFQIQDQPTNGDISENNGEFSYAPDNGFNGVDQASYVVVDSEGLLSEPVNITINVEASINQPPEIISTAPSSGLRGIDLQYDVQATDPDGDVLSYELLNGPSTASINFSDGLISWTPEADYSLGLDSVNEQCQLIAEQADDFRKVQLVTLIDGSGSMSDERAFLSTWLPQLNGEMLAFGLGQNDAIDFAVGRFERRGLLQQLPSGSVFGNIDEISNILVPISDLTGPGGGNENGVNSLIDILEDNQYDEAAQQIFILMTDEGCSSCPNAPQYTEQLNDMLAARQDVLHTIIPSYNMTCPDGRPVMGIDHLYNGYVAETNGNFSVCKNAVFSTPNANLFNHYIEPAFLTGGSVWDVSLISGADQNSQSASESIAKVIAKISQLQTATENAADLYFSELSQNGAQLNIAISNRGLIDSQISDLSLVDANGQELIFTVPVLVPGATENWEIDLSTVATGALSLVVESNKECSTDNNTVKMAYFDVSVDDQQGGTDNQAFLLSVTETNVPPTINPINDIQTPAGVTLSVVIPAEDTNKGDILAYQIMAGSEQATISQAGILEWKPVDTDVGISQVFTIAVTDLAGASVSTSFTVDVVDSIAPLQITSTPERLGIYGTTYEYQVVVTHDPVSTVDLRLLNGAEGMTMDSQGLITWSIAVDSEVEVITVVIVADDQFGNTDTQAFLVAIDEPAEAPIITTSMDIVTIEGEVFGYTSVVTDINAFESFLPEFLVAPDLITISNYSQPVPDFQYEELIAHRLQPANTVHPEYSNKINHWCGTDDPEWINLTPQLADFIEIGPRIGDTFAANIIVTSLTDTNADGLTNQNDTQYIIHTFENGIAALNSQSLEQTWVQPDVRAMSGGFNNQLAAADIDQDGNTEILVMGIDGFLKVLSHEGELLWVSEDSVHGQSAGGTLVMAKDLDADGDLEIIAGTKVFDHTGQLLIDMGRFNFTSPTYAAVADLDQDGTLEIIQHNTIFNHDGSVYFDGLGNGNFYAIANFDNDPELEFVQVKKLNNSVTLFNHDGTVIWETEVKTANLPSVADIDHDGMLEIVMTYATIKADGTIMRDEPGDNRYDSRLTDLNADGAFELITYWGQLNAKDPITGDRIFEWKRSRGFYDFALIDRYNTGEYEILFPHWSGAGVFLDFIKAADGAWTGGAGETKQSVYDQTLNAAGEPNLSYGVMLNQTFENFLTPDLHVTGPQVSESTNGYQIYTQLSNITPSFYAGELQINFYHDEIDANNLIGSELITDLDVNQTKTVVLSDFIDPYNPPGETLIAEVVQVIPVNECRTDNNVASSEYVFWQVTDSTGLSDQQAYSIRVKQRDYLPYAVEALPVANALQNYQESFVLLGNQDNVDIYFLVYQKPDGMNISSSGEINWIPTIDQLGQHTIIMYLQSDQGISQYISTTITVEPPINQPPVITSDAITEGQFNFYTYDVDATDPENDVLTYSFNISPLGADIDANTGLISWVPGADFSTGLDSPNLLCRSSISTPNPDQSAELIFMIDGSGSMDDAHAYIPLWMPLLDGEMKGQNLGIIDENKYGLTLFADAARIIELSPGNRWGSVNEVIDTTIPWNGLNSGMGTTENLVFTMNQMLDAYQFTESKSKSVVYMTDEKCANCDDTPNDTGALTERLLDNQITMHGVIDDSTSFVEFGIACGDGTPAMGITPENIGYVADGDGGFYTCAGAAFTEVSANVITHHINPTFATGGSIWDITYLQGTARNQESLSKAMSLVIAGEALSQVSTVDQVDLMIKSTTINQSQLEVTVLNRGLESSNQFDVQLLSGQNLINSQSISLLAAGEEQQLIFDLTGLEYAELALTIDNSLTENECSVDNNSMLLSYFSINVEDPDLASDTQAYFVDINEDNVAPVIESVPTATAEAGVPYVSQVVATDANKGDRFSYVLTQGAHLASIDAITGEFTWLPSSDQDQQTFEVAVLDIAGASDSMSFTLTVSGDYYRPQIISSALRVAQPGNNYLYQILLDSHPSSVLNYQLLSGPQGMNIDPTGLISWSVPGTATDEIYAVAIKVADQYGNFDTQAYVLAIDEDEAQPPVLTNESVGRTVEEQSAYQNSMNFNDVNAVESFEFYLQRHPAGMVVSKFDPSGASYSTNVAVTLAWGEATTSITEKTAFTNHWCGNGDVDWVNLASTKETTLSLGPESRTKMLPNFLLAALTDSTSDGVVNGDDDKSLIYVNDNGINALDGQTLNPLWTYGGAQGISVTLGGGQYNALALANLDNDDSREVLFLDESGFVFAINTDGTLRWQSDDAIAANTYRTSLIVTDLTDDGIVEILVGNLILNSDGTTRATLPVPSFLASRNQFEMGTVDTDSDGQLEVLYDDALYNNQGVLIYDDLGSYGNHFAAVEVDSDSHSEWIQVDDVSNRVSLFDHDATILWQTNIQNTTRPAVADIDHDGELEIVFAGAALEMDGNIIYNNNGSTVDTAKLVDLNNDGAFELLKHNSSSLNIIDPITSQSIYQWSATGEYDQSFVGDANGDGEVNLFIPHISGGQLYLDVIGSSDDVWTGAADELTQALRPQALLNSNTGLVQTNYQVELSEVNLNTIKPDFHVEGPQIMINGGDYEISTQLRNLTPSQYTGLLSVSFYDGTIDPANLLGTEIINDLGLNEVKTVTLSTTYALTDINSDRLVAEVSSSNPAIECTTHNNQAASELVYWVLEDSYGLTTEKAYMVRVQEINRPPRRPATLPQATALQAYQAQFVSENLPLNEQVIYHSVDVPEGMTISSSGLINWAPRQDQVGSHQIVVSVHDVLGQLNHYTVNISVAEQNNAPPVFNSAPTLNVDAGQAYTYTAQATDPEGQTVTYELIETPAGVSIDASTGLVNWTPNESQVGDNVITIRATDADSVFADQSFVVTVNDVVVVNTPPSIDSIPSNIGAVGRTYQYIANVIDDSPVLNYQIIQGPNGMSLDQNGLVSWIPSSLGDFNVLIQVDDGEFFIQQGWTITVIDPGAPLGGDIELSATVVIINNSVEVTVIPTGNIGNTSVVATLDGQPLVLDANYQATIPADTLGTYTIDVSITDEYDSIDLTAEFEVIEDTVLTPPVVDILTPGDGNIITGFNDISVLVEDDNLASWKLSYRYAEDDPTQVPRITIAEGTDNVPSEVVANWDTSLLMNGVYVLVIEALDDTGLYSNIAHSVFLEGDLKLGHFSIAFEDMSIPVAGIPISITRGYDTRERNRDRAFGKGWSIGFQSLRLQESRIPGLGWYQQIEYFQPPGLPVTFPRYCIEPAGQPLVSVRMPDGSLEKFKVKAKVGNPTPDEPEKTNCQDFIAPELFAIEFIPQGDTNSKLTSNTGSSGLGVQGGNLVPFAEFEPVDPNVYTLTTLDGTTYSLDQGFNVREIETTAGYTLTFTENGIEHSGGLAVSFIRDIEGRITRIEKQDGEGVDYSYDTNGDLATFTDLKGNTTTFTYIQDHYLEDIIDPRGIRVARNVYDAEGRLEAHIDALGNRIEYDNDLVNMTSTITDRRGNPTINAFDNAGNIVAQTNALGETTSYEYNDIYLETARTNHLGHRTEWTYDSMGNQLTEKDPLGHISTSTFNNRGELLTQVDALNQPVITNVYVPQSNAIGTGQLSTVTDALGRVTEFHWLTDSTGTTANTGFTDAAGNEYDITPINGGTNSGLSGATTDLNGLKTESTYDDEARPLTETQIITDDMGVETDRYTTTYEYNSNGDVVKMTDALGNITRTEYDALNKVSATIDALGRRTEMEYDDRGNQVLTRYPDGSTETMVYDAENNVIETTDRAGRTTKTIYDALNRVEAVIYPDETPGDDTDNPMTVNSYDAAGRLVAVSDAGGNVTSYEYDDAGRRTKTIDALLNETSSVYDALGRRTQSTDALGRVTTFEYNALGNLERTNFDNGLFTTVEYDQLSRKVAETDLAGLRTEYEYDAAGNLIAVIDALGQRTEYSYDQRGNKLTQTDARGNTTSWTYDALSRVTSRTLPMGEFESYTYDAVGNRISKTDFNGDTTTYEYNNLNQLVLTTYSDFTTVANTYTITGQMETVTEINGTTTYSYDSQDRLIRIDYPTGNYIEYGYDLNGNKTEVTTANQTVTNTYDELNRLKTVTDSSGTTTYTYDAVGNRASQINANGTVATYSYDALNRLDDLVHTDSLNVEIASYSYELGPNGNRLSLTEGTGRVVEYGYDALYRLETETVTDAINGNHFSQWSYDAVGNRLQQDIDGVVTTYTYNDNDHLLTETENGIITSYVYDANGNTLTKTVGAALDAEYTYSKDNRMLTANTNGSSISYSYDAGGIRQSQTVDGVITHYLVDPNRSYHQVLEEQDDLFLPQVVYTYGDDLINQTNSQGVHTFGYDGLGSTRILTDASGVVQNSYGYQAFGELDYQYGAVENDYLFTGEQYDNNVGFYYLRARYYNPSIGRFQNMDTFPGMQFEPLSLHKYLYTHADPINNIDPSGYFSIGSFAAASRVAGIISKYAIRVFAADVGLHATGFGYSHKYEFKRRICKIGSSGCTKKNVFFALRHFPAPVTTVQLAGPTTVSTLWGLPGQRNDVTHSIKEASYTVVNHTEPSHVFHDGTVERKVISLDGYLQIHSIGVGVNSSMLYSYLNARLAPAVFAWPDARIKGYIESGEIKPENNFGLWENFCYVGVFCN